MRLHSVVVAYRPDHAALRALCESLVRSGSVVTVVDNTEPHAQPAFEAPACCSVIALGRNAGVATALNAGIRHALEQGAEAVVTFDQDSVVVDGFLARLVRPLVAGEPGVAAPVARSKSNGAEYPARRLGRFGQSLNVFAGASPGAPVPVDVVISSGCAATAPTFKRVGLMDDALFIDFVDVDWCLRCRARGVPIVVVPDAVMTHAIGERMVRAPFGLYRGILHSPFRTYFKVRNAFLLARRPHVPRAFGVRQVASALGHNAVQLLFVRERVLHARSLLAAVADGMRGVSGERNAAVRP